MKTASRFLTAVLFASLFAAAAQAEIYRWVDADGTVHYGDQPKRGAKPADLPDLYKADRIPVPTNRPNDSVADSAKAALTAMRIVSPEAEQTFRDPQGSVEVALQLDPGLPAGVSLMYFINGSPVSSEATRAERIRIEGVTAGSHTVSAAAVRDGVEVARASPVVFFMRPPTAIKPLRTPGSGGPSNNANAPPATQTGGVLGAPRSSGTGAPAAP
jgi:hypothetical protein